LHFNETLEGMDSLRQQSTAAPAVRGLTKDDIIAFVSNLCGVVAVTGAEANGAPEIAWGDSFFFYDPDGEKQTSRRMPFRHDCYQGLRRVRRRIEPEPPRCVPAEHRRRPEGIRNASSATRPPRMPTSTRASTSPSWAGCSHIRLMPARPGSAS
jgi:hypothetical protein